MIDLRGLAFVVVTGVGAVAGSLLALALSPVGIFFPSLLSWLWVFPVAGTFIGALLGAYAEKR